LFAKLVGIWIFPLKGLMDMPAPWSTGKKLRYGALTVVSIPIIIFVSSFSIGSLHFGGLAHF
jgi:hypothetical protein